MKKYLFILTAIIFTATSCTIEEVYQTQKDTTPQPTIKDWINTPMKGIVLDSNFKTLY